MTAPLAGECPYPMGSLESERWWCGRTPAPGRVYCPMHARRVKELPRLTGQNPILANWLRRPES